MESMKLKYNAPLLGEGTGFYDCRKLSEGCHKNPNSFPSDKPDILIEDIEMAKRTRKELGSSQVRKWYNKYPYWNENPERCD